MRTRRGAGLLGILLTMSLLAAGGEGHAAIDLSLLFEHVAGRVPSPEAIIQHLVDRGREAEFTGEQETTLFGPPFRVSRQEVVQKSGRRRLTYLSPPELKGKQVYSEGRRSLLSGGVDVPDIGLGEDLGSLVKSVRGTDEIAGRLAYVIEVRAPSRGGASRRIWVDADHWVPLRWEDRDASGDLVSKTTYTRIRFGRDVPNVVPPRAFTGRSHELELRSAGGISLEEVARQVRFRVRKPEHLPTGYRYHTATIKTMGTGRRAVNAVTTTYTNDLGVITLSQAPARAIRGAPKPGARRQTSIGTVWVEDDFHFVLAATPPLPREEMERIAASVR
ncbi:MAG: hypothetical protein HY321_05225 [Armatimonadetes bacterium]|nr:hypothetical protein [Armatimonadota bacterium]